MPRKTIERPLVRKIFGRETFQRGYRRAVSVVERRPLASFFTLLALMFLLIIAGNFLRRPAAEPVVKAEPKNIGVYTIGRAPRMTFQGQVEKSASIQIVAQTGGIVQNIYFAEGDTVYQGQWLVSLSSNYQGGNAMTLSRELAQKQNEMVEANYPASKDLIGKQRDVANRSYENTQEMLDITKQSVDSTQDIVNLNSTIIQTLNDTIAALSSNPDTATGSASTILASKQMVSQFLSANLQLNNSLRQARYQTDPDNPPSELAILQRDITLRQLDVQEKSLDLNREISQLQLQLAKVNEALMFPAAPFAATVEKVYVRPGQSVNPGTPLVSLAGTSNRSVKVTVYLSRELAGSVSTLEDSVITVGTKQIKLQPSYVTHEAVQGNLYGVIFTLPDDSYDLSTDKGYVLVEIPVGHADTSAAVPYIPLDAVYRTQSEAYVFIVKDGKAVSKKITLGDVLGRLVTVTDGIGGGDRIILDRNVTAGDAVSVQ